MKVWRLSNRENFVGKRQELVFDAFTDSGPLERATVRAREFWICWRQDS